MTEPQAIALRNIFWDYIIASYPFPPEITDKNVARLSIIDPIFVDACSDYLTGRGLDIRMYHNIYNIFGQDKDRIEQYSSAQLNNYKASYIIVRKLMNKPEAPKI